ncbi:hypothetical protein NQ318_010518 [Aromia moschata]|uniref:Uncharacterized protein n=1 Tax=Aromia moschata TaxID=1265417 RepID=A0AAV8YGI4_9CUCU|nr:hypothetical protein NQ318_010518 [Aromia moschata]
MDFYVWGRMKSKVYAEPVNDEASLRARILQGFCKIARSCEELARSCEDLASCPRNTTSGVSCSRAIRSQERSRPDPIPTRGVPKIDRKYARKKKSNHRKDLLPVDLLQRRRRLEQKEGLVMYTYREATMIRVTHYELMNPSPRLSLIFAGGGDEISSYHCLQQQWVYKDASTKA